MQTLVEKYNIKDSFLTRYFEENAENRFGIELLKFMWNREGKFLNPQKKGQYLKEYISEEINNFYEKNELNIPFLEFCITTKCTLNCKDCCALIPQFKGNNHITISLEQFKSQIDKLCNNVNRIRHLVLLGGEPLIYQNLPDIVEYAGQKNNIDFIRITTNGTIMPSEKLIEVIKKYRNRIYFFISNYKANEELENILKIEELKTALTQNNIRFQMVDNWNWLSELGVATEKFPEYETLEKFKNCYRTKCTQVLNGKIDVCSKALTARELRLIQANDYIDLETTQNLRDDLIGFYQKNYQKACEYCIISNKSVIPALQ